MRKIVIFYFFFSFFLAYQPILAQTASPSSLPLSPSPKPNLVLAKKLGNVLARLKAAVSRAEKISGRILTRLTKLQVNQTASGSGNLTALFARQKDIAVSLEQIKIDAAQLDLASQTLVSASTPRKDFPVFKNQVLLVTKNLKDVYKTELDLVSDLKLIASVTAVPSVRAVPTK